MNAPVENARALRPPLVAWSDALDEALRHGPLLTPTRRLAREIAYAVDWRQRQGGARAWPTPDVLTVDAYLRRCYTQAQDAGAPGADALLLSEEIVPFAMERAAPNAEWTRNVKVFAAAWRTAKLHGVRSDDPALARTDNGKVYARWAQAFENLLREQGCITPAELPARLVRLVDGPRRWRPAAATALRWEPPTPAVARFLTAADCARVRPPDAAPAAVAQRLVADDSGHEQALAAAWARERLSADPDARIGVVLPALGGAFAAIERQFQALFPDVGDASEYVNVSGGLALDEEPLCRAALELLACSVGESRAVWRGLSQSPFLRLRLPVDGLREHADLAALAARFATTKLKRLAATLEAGRRRSPWAPLVANLLELAGWSAGPLDSREAQAKTQFEQCLEAFALAERVAGFRDWASAVAGLRRLAGGRLFAPRTPAAPIQVMGRAESVGLAFDHLWLAGLTQADWPPVPTPNPLLPLAVQRRAGVAALALDEEWERARETTARWRTAATHVVASHSGADDASSPLVADFQAIAAAEVIARPSLAAGPHPWAVAGDVALEEWTSEDAGPLSDAKQAGGASVLEDQSLCPFRAWARHRLQLREPRQRARFPDAAERGTVVHEILATLLGRYPNRTALMAMPPDAIVQTVQETLAERERWPTLYREREAHRLVGLLAAWFQQETRRPDFTVLAVEHATTVTIGGLELDLRIDRIDQVSFEPTDADAPPSPPGDKPLVLVDFKTGRVSTRDWLPPRPAAPQLPLYALALADGNAPFPGEPRAIAFGQVRPEQIRFTGLGDPAAQTGLQDPARAFGKSFAALRGEWETSLTALAQAFATGHAPVDPFAPAVCARCHLHALCRVDDPA